MGGEWRYRVSTVPNEAVRLVVGDLDRSRRDADEVSSSYRYCVSNLSPWFASRRGSLARRPKPTRSSGSTMIQFSPYGHHPKGHTGGLGEHRLPRGREGAVEPAVVTVAATAATTLVAAMTTDAWGHVKYGCARLLRLEGAARSAEGAEQELEQARTTVLAARDCGDASRERDVLDLLAARLGEVLEANAQRADEVEDLLRQVLAGNPAADRQIHAFTEAFRPRGSTVYNQWVDNGGGGAQGSGSTATVNNHHHAPGTPDPS